LKTWFQDDVLLYLFILKKNRTKDILSAPMGKKNKEINLGMQAWFFFSFIFPFKMENAMI